MIRVAIADDQPLVRSGLMMILAAEDDIDVVGQAADGDSALEVVASTAPDVLLLDVQMPGMDGLAVMERLTAMEAATRWRSRCAGPVGWR
jgi:DNA-binding NarL/FixJ family response regulator